MNAEPDVEQRPIFKRILTPWGIAAILLAIFFVAEGYLALRDRSLQTALENSPEFATPAFDLAFSKSIAYDPLTFVGKGAQADLWKWSPDGLILTDKGRQFFEESGDQFISRAATGKRRLRRIRTNQATNNGDRRIGFLYEWVEISPPAAVLLVPPLHMHDDYPGEAIMTRENGSWKLRSLRTQDFDDSMKHLKEAASGVLK